MNTNLAHLPEDKQHQLRWAVDIIIETVSPEMVILFGSYARGDWVEELADDGVHYQYQSDFDLLAVVKDEVTATKVERSDSLYNRLNREINTPVSLIAEDIHLLNRRIRKGQYFYTDILQEGILLHSSGAFELAKPKGLSSKERTNLAQEDFDYWFDKANKYKEYSDIAVSRNDFNEAAFFLHQSVERFYGAILLVFTRYKPNSHDLRKLGQRVASIEPEFLKVFPQGTEEDKAKFELLRKAYVNARYKPSYTITEQELEWLAERVSHLKELTEKFCKAKIENYKS